MSWYEDDVFGLKESPPDQMVGPDGQFAGFKRPCGLCEGYYSPSHFLSDGLCRHAPRKDPAELLTVGEWREMAERWTALALLAIERGDETEAAVRAKAVVTFCREFQLAGGKPWD